jgi:hypothetical protein
LRDARSPRTPVGTGVRKGVEGPGRAKPTEPTSESEHTLPPPDPSPEPPSTSGPPESNNPATGRRPTPLRRARRPRGPWCGYTRAPAGGWYGSSARGRWSPGSATLDRLARRLAAPDVSEGPEGRPAGRPTRCACWCVRPRRRLLRPRRPDAEGRSLFAARGGRCRCCSCCSCCRCCRCRCCSCCSCCRCTPPSSMGETHSEAAPTEGPDWQAKHPQGPLQQAWSCCQRGCRCCCRCCCRRTPSSSAGGRCPTASPTKGPEGEEGTRGAVVRQVTHKRIV